MAITLKYKHQVKDINYTDYLGDDTWHFLNLKDPVTGLPLDLRNHTGLAQVKADPTSATALGAFTVILTNTYPNITLKMPAAMSAQIGAGTFSYDFQLISPAPDNFTQTYTRGVYVLEQDTSR